MIKNIQNKEIIDKIIDIEWKMFQDVENIGGRASCQDDFETFYIMRYSQYGSWPNAMTEYYLDFATQCRDAGRNLVSEKYARMMRYTNPEYYNSEFSAVLPPITPVHNIFIDQIVEAMITWEKELGKEFPDLAATGRPITSNQDGCGMVSMETYARGELETYPLELLSLYCEYIKKLKKTGQSLSVINQKIMVSLHGYNSIQEAQSFLQHH